MIPRLKELYTKQIRPELKEKFSTMGFLPEGFTWVTSEVENSENTNED